MVINFQQEERARRLHTESVVVLAHDHFPPPQDIEALQAGGVTAKILLAVMDARVYAPEFGDYERSIPRIEGWFHYAVGIYEQVLAAIESSSRLLVIRKSADVIEAKRQGKTGILLGAEGGKLIEYRLQNLSNFYRMGLRHILLSWAYNNQITHGELDKDGQGLTAFGRQVVEEMNELGMIVDITHVARPAMREVLEVSKRPVLNSHTTLKSISNRVPSLTEQEAREIAERGGVIALHFMTHMLTGRFDPPAQLEELLYQMDELLKVVGIENVALGPDYLPYTNEFKRNTGQHNLTFPVGLESAGSLLNLTRGLVARGYNDDAIQKILGGNLLRLFRDTLG